MKKLLILLVLFSWQEMRAQHTVVEESLIEVNCESMTHATVQRREVVTILNEQGADYAGFTCSCSKQVRLVKFRGQVSDATGRVIRKLKESELKRTEYSEYFAVDDYTMYFDYTPPTYPVTITYEWSMDIRDNLVEFPVFCPFSGYDVSVKKATYKLVAPKDMKIRYTTQHIDHPVAVADAENGKQMLTLEVSDLPAIRREPYIPPLRELLPMAYFAPQHFSYYGTQGSLGSWKDYGRWQYGLLEGRDALPEELKTKLHQMTDHLKTDREKVDKVYKYLQETTRYVAVLLGVGGLQPTPAADVYKSGFGDCKGLSNYMRAMLQVIGIASNYTVISMNNRRLLKDFASIGQMNHVILQVPLPGDTLWLECTSSHLPMGYVHEDIAGHDAIEISSDGGRMVRLPVYADSTNLMHTTAEIQLASDGAATMVLLQTVHNRQYENSIPLLKMKEKDCQRVMLNKVRVPQATVSQLDVREVGQSIIIDAQIESAKYASVTGQRLFVPVCPIHQGYSAPVVKNERQWDVYVDMGYLDIDDFTMTIPEGYEIESLPKKVVVEKPFGKFTFDILKEEDKVHVKYSLLMKSGSYEKAKFQELSEFIKQVSSSYGQKMVLKKK